MYKMRDIITFFRTILNASYLSIAEKTQYKNT